MGETWRAIFQLFKWCGSGCLEARGLMLGAQSSFGWSIPYSSGAKASAVGAASCGNELLLVLLVFDNGCFQGRGTGFWEDLHSYGFCILNTPGEVIEVV